MKWSDSINQKPTDLYTHAHTYTTLSEDKQKSILWTYTFHFCLFVLHLESIRLQDQYIIDRVPFISFFKIFFLLFCLVIFFFCFRFTGKCRKATGSDKKWKELTAVKFTGNWALNEKMGGKSGANKKWRKRWKQEQCSASTLHPSLAVINATGICETLRGSVRDPESLQGTARDFKGLWGNRKQEAHHQKKKKKQKKTNIEKKHR